MPRKYDEYEERMSGTLREDFGTANPGYWSDVLRNPRAVQAVRDLQKQTEARRAELRADHDRTRSERISREAVTVFEERSRPGLDHPAPLDVNSANLSHGSILGEARRRVEADAHREDAVITKLEQDSIEDIAEQERVAGMTHEQRTEHIKKDVHQAVDAAQNARTEARRAFAKDRQTLIDQAREAGSETPERDVSVAHAKALKEIDRREHRDLHSIFQKYGWDYEKQDVAFSNEVETTHEEETEQAVENDVADQTIEQGAVPDLERDQSNEQGHGY